MHARYTVHLPNILYTNFISFHSLRILTELGSVTVVSIVLLLPIALSNGQFAGVDSINPGVFALDSKPYGSTYGHGLLIGGTG